MITEVTSGKRAVCADILKSLPQWFGIPESNAAYERAVETLPMFGAVKDGAVIGFLALEKKAPQAFEIHVMGVRPEHHRHGIGAALVTRAEVFAREDGARVLTVKTLSPSHPDPNYRKTRAFYEKMGFIPLEEFPTLWNPENPALMLAKFLA